MLINPDEITKSLSSYNWCYKNKVIEKEFNFNSYMEGIEFVNNIARIAEKHNHHPDIMLGWCNIKISISSHDLGGVSTKCVNLAIAIENI